MLVEGIVEGVFIWSFCLLYLLICSTRREKSISLKYAKGMDELRARHEIEIRSRDERDLLMDPGKELAKSKAVNEEILKAHLEDILKVVELEKKISMIPDQYRNKFGI